MSKVLGFITLENGEKLTAHEPTLGEILDRVNDSSQPIGVFTVPALCLGKSEDFVRSLGLSEGGQVFELCQSTILLVQKLGERLKGNDGSNASNVNTKQH